MATRSQIENAGRRVRKAVEAGAEPAAADLLVIEEFRSLHTATLVFTQGLLTANLPRANIAPDQLAITSRPKTREAIIAKMCRTRMALPRMQDIAGVRVVVPSLENQQAALGIVAERLDSDGERTKDTTQDGDRWGYRAIHVIGKPYDHLVEVQIRTQMQDRWAQIVESLDKALKLDLKHGRGPADWIQWLQELSDELRKADLGEPYAVPDTPFDMLIPPP